MAMLENGAGELDNLKLFHEVFEYSECRSFAKPEEAPTTRLSSSSRQSEAAGGSMAVGKLLQSISKEPSRVSNTNRTSRVPLSADDLWNDEVAQNRRPPRGPFFYKTRGVVSHTPVVELTTIVTCRWIDDQSRNRDRLSQRAIASVQPRP